MKVFRRHALQKGLGDWQQDSIAFTAQLGSERTGSLGAFVSKAGLDILTSHSSSLGDIVLYWQWCRRTFSLLESSPSPATTVWFSSQERTVPGLSLLNAPSGTFPGVTVTHCHQSCKAWLSKEITFEPSSPSMVKCSCFQNNLCKQRVRLFQEYFLTPLFWDLLARLHISFVYSSLWRFTGLYERLVSFVSE